MALSTIRVRKFVMMLVMVGLASRVAASGCPPVIDAIWDAAITAGISALTDGVMGMVTGVNDQNTINEQRTVSAIKVQAKQIAASAQKEIANMSGSMQGLATTVVSQQTAEQMQKALGDYGLATGQGYDPCGELTKAKIVTGGYAATLEVGTAVRGSIDAAPGVYKDRATALANRMSEHKQLFCTQSEVTSGLCPAVGANPGESLTFVTMFTTAPVGSNTDKAKNAFVNHIFGLPDQPLDPAKANTPETQVQIRDKMMRDGYRSIAETSFKAIQAMSTSDPTGTNSNTNNNGYIPTVSFLDALDQKVDQYAGGVNFRAWAKTLAMQGNRGLMVDLAKMEAFKLYLASVEYDQYERMEANLAALLALENRRRGH
jgi:hypothetical protein